MKLAVFGSRVIKDNRVELEISQFINDNPEFDTIITAQEPKGVCSIAQLYAKKNSMILELHFLNIKKFARGAFSHRSADIIGSADHVLLIHDGKSKGTSNELAQVKKAGKPYTYVVLDKTTALENVETSDILRPALSDDFNVEMV
jgi:hypothetical protein